MTSVPQPSRAVALLLSRKAALEEMIRERFRVARERGTKADVLQLSASLRQVKRSLKSASRAAGSDGKSGALHAGTT